MSPTAVSAGILPPLIDRDDENFTARKHCSQLSTLEVSSYQLELSSSISSDIAVLLNVTQDHLDRHSSFEEYKGIKNKVFIQSKLAIREGQSSLSTEKCIYFQEIFKDYDYCFDDLKYEWPLHDLENIKATISILFAYLVLNEEINFYDKPQRESFIKDCLRILNSYQRLPHRYEILDLKDGVTFINDSKATNVASLLKALESVYDKYGEGKVILICGGDSKGQDFQELTNIQEKLLKKAYIFGIHKDLIAPFLINTDVGMSTIVAQRIVDTIANYPFKMDAVEANITISGGMSEYPSDSKDMKELIEFADRAMYSSKGVGGNKFSIHSDIVSQDE